MGAISQAQSRPIATPAPSAMASGAAAKAAATLNVLIVEEEGYTRTLLRTVARALGAEQIETADGVKPALRLVEEKSINLVISDLNLPEMSGLDFLAELRRRSPDIQFLLISNKSDPEHIQQAVNSGVSAILVRPFSRAQVEAKLRHLANRIAPNLVPTLARAAPMPHA